MAGRRNDYTNDSALTFGFPLNFGSSVGAVIGMIIAVVMLPLYIVIMQEYLPILDFPHSNFLVRRAMTIVVLCYVLIVTYAIGFIARIFLLYGSIKIRLAFFRYAYIVVMLEILIILICTIVFISLEDLEAMGLIVPPICFTFAVIQFYFIAVFIKTDMDIKDNTVIEGASVMPQIPRVVSSFEAGPSSSSRAPV